jgi:hypothetical protein
VRTSIPTKTPRRFDSTFLFALAINKFSGHEGVSSVGIQRKFNLHSLPLCQAALAEVSGAPLFTSAQGSNHINGHYFQDVHPRVDVVQP